ncbi:MAG: polysaccharide deacetylase family protein [Gemmatimonadaceae bacterium]|nr:polysaccharide deacetylase family protein [Gemmatimonadaceae bacterium]
MLRATLRLAKRGILHLASFTGVDSRVRDSEWRRRRLAVIAYHGVSRRDEHLWNDELYVTPEHLRRRLTFLRAEGYVVLPLREGLERLTAGTLPPRAVALTFDDGFRDFADMALPLLSEFNAHATAFVTTHHAVDGQPVFLLALDYLLWHARAVPARNALLGGARVTLETGDRAARFRTRERVEQQLRGRRATPADRMQLLVEVARALDLDAIQLLGADMMRIMTIETLRALPTSLVDLQLHTHRHRMPAAAEELQRELDDNRRVLGTAIPSERCVDTLCYPSGEHDPASFDLLRAWGVRHALTCLPGLASPLENPLIIRRWTDTMGVSDLMFSAMMSGVATALPSRATIGLPQPAAVPPPRRSAWNRMRGTPSVRSGTTQSVTAKPERE